MNDTSHGEAVWAVIPAGGSGSRFSKQQDKLLADLAGTPVLIRSLQALLAVNAIQGIVLVSSQQNLLAYQELISRYLPDAPVQYATGGNTRRDSVYQGLLAVPDTAGIVVIHDAARPLIRPETIEQSIEAVRQGGAAGAIVAAPIHDTVKQVSAHSLQVHATLDRSVLWRVQTPQTFQKALLLQAHQQIANDIPVTDDAQLLELAALGPVVIVPGNDGNLKITVEADILLAEALLSLEVAHNPMPSPLL